MRGGQPTQPSDYRFRSGSTLHASTSSSIDSPRVVPKAPNEDPRVRSHAAPYGWTSAQPGWNPDDPTWALQANHQAIPLSEQTSHPHRSVGRHYIPDDRVPVGRYGYPDMATPTAATSANMSASEPSKITPSRYKCTFCDKAFNRPSSLKVMPLFHLLWRSVVLRKFTHRSI